MKKLITVIGGSGFVGSRLIEKLGKENCRNIDKNQSRVYGDITIIQDVRTKDLSKDIPGDTDTVILLAAEHRDDVSPVSLYYDVNVDGAQNVLRAMDCLGIKKLIFTSSVAVYGLNKDNPDENHPADPFNHYGKSKRQAEEVLRSWFYEDPQSRSLTIIRPTVILGERNRGNVYNLLQQISSGRFLMIGTGQNKKSMAYVGNVAAFIEYCLRNMQEYQVYNYVDKPDMDMNQLAEHVGKVLQKKIPSLHIPYHLGMMGGYGFDILAKLVNKKLPISSVRIRKFCATTQFDSTKMISCGFSPPYTLAEGLARTLKFEFMEKGTADGLIYNSE
jgi:nucleoside-diphosphate-sugar epimerase